MTGSEPLYRFVQLEFGWPLGPDDGRYLVRPAVDAEAEHVLVLATLGATKRHLVRGRRGRDAPPEPDPAPVPVGRATVIPAAALADEAEAAQWLSAMTGERAEEEVEAAVRTLNRALQGHRVAAADAFAHEVTSTQAHVVRVGYGRGEQVAEGRWTAARELPPPKGRRVRRMAALRPQERLAALLAGRDAPLACEELVLRARMDLDHDRPREAALGLRVALEAALAELDPHRPVGMRERLDDLRDRREAVGAAANAALKGPLPDDLREAVDEGIERVSAALRARSAAGI